MEPEVQKHIEYASGYLDLKMFGDALREADLALALARDRQRELPQALALAQVQLAWALKLSQLRQHPRASLQQSLSLWNRHHQRHL